MELIPIFADEETGEGLYAVCFDGEEEDEWIKLINRWLDPEYVTAYCLQQAAYINNDYFRRHSIDSLASKIEKEAIELEQRLFDLTEEGIAAGIPNLQQLFRPLDDREYVLYELQRSKGKLTDYPFHPGLLRVYALRIEANTYVITGGAIKLVHEMEEHVDTRHELDKLDKVHRWLAERDLISAEAIQIFLYEE